MTQFACPKCRESLLEAVEGGTCFCLDYKQFAHFHYEMKCHTCGGEFDVMVDPRTGFKRITRVE